MTAEWDAFAHKIRANSMTIEDITGLVEFLKEFDAANNDIIVTGVKRYMEVWHFDFTGWEMFMNQCLTGKMSSRQMETLIGYLHDFDHGNEQVLAYTIGKKHYWRDHKSFRSWMGTFSNGEWKYSERYKESVKKYEESRECPR